MINRVPSQADFREWLLECTPLGDRAASDVCSRLRRVINILDRSRLASGNDLVGALVRSSEFKELSPSVQSQLKRAANLYWCFRNQLPYVRTQGPRAISS